MDYIELNAIVKPLEPFADIIISRLADVGFDSFVTKEDGFSAYIPEDNLDQNDLEQLKTEMRALCEFSFVLNHIPAQNWNQAWEQSFQPITVGDKCIVKAPFHSQTENFKYTIVIEPKMSFGTGHHETTYMMLEALLDSDVTDKKILDMGCGSGILAILASMRDANSILAVDIDEWCYLNSLENIKVNNINNVIVNKGGAEILSGQKFDIILANINKNVLLSQLQHYAASLEKAGTLFMSGFFTADITELESEAKIHGFVLQSQKEKNTWAMLKFVKA